MKFILIGILFSIPLMAAQKVSVPAVKVPSVKVGETQVTILAIARDCWRKASFFEQLNNGLDAWTSCNDFTVSPANTLREGLIVSANSKGEFEIPEEVVTYSNRLFKEEVVCFSVIPVSYIRQYQDYKYAVDYATVEKLRYCTKNPLPDWMGPGLRKAQVLLIPDYEKTMSQGIQFTPAR